jgi:hypothetical protein
MLMALAPKRPLSLDSMEYAIDLSDYNAKKLRDALDGYISKHLLRFARDAGSGVVPTISQSWRQPAIST